MEISTALAESMIAQENARLRGELAKAHKVIDHQRMRIERYNAQRLRDYTKAPRPSIGKQLLSLLIVKEARA